MTQVRAVVAQSMKAAANQSTSHQVPPAAVIWLDPDSLWASAIPRLQEALPVLTFGDHDPSTATGPAIWLRAVLVSETAQQGLPSHLHGHDETHPWVIYLPGVTPTDLAETGTLPETLKPLADLVNRSALWQQSARTPWHPHAFLRSKDGAGLNLDGREDTRKATVTMLPRLLAEDMEDLRRGPVLDADRLRALALPDPIRTLLRWINDPTTTRGALDEESWAAFTAASRSRFGLNPSGDTTITAARMLGRRLGAWGEVWDRYVEAPANYPDIPDELEKARPAELFTDDPEADPHPDSWPSWNSEQEKDLSATLAVAAAAPTPQAARAALKSAHLGHRARASSLWATLGKAPLASALEPLAELADRTTKPFPSATVGEIATWYAETGHQVDALALASLAAVKNSDREAIRGSIAAVYDPWAHDVATAFQAAARSGYPGEVGLTAAPGTCVVFVDALRYDLAVDLGHRLETTSLAVATDFRIGAFPSLTPTGQPAVAPLDPHALGWTGGPDFCAADSAGRPLKGTVLRQALKTAGIDYLEWSELGDPAGRAWTQMSSIDSLGHSQGRGLVDSLDGQVDTVASRIRALLAHGWKRILVVTDHGFLLPAGNPLKVDLPLALTEGENTRKPRVARLRPGNTHPTYPATPWTWDPSVTFVSPPGVAVFAGGVPYEHGGLSPQECVIPVLTVTLPLSPLELTLAKVTEVKWTNQRCRIDMIPSRDDVSIEVRLRPGDATSSVGGPKAPRDGEVKILVDESDAAPGTTAHVVVLDSTGAVIAQKETIVGGPK